MPYSNRFLLYFIVALLTAAPAEAAEFTVGPNQQFSTLNSLFTPGRPLNNGVISLYGNDASLNGGTFDNTVNTLTIRSGSGSPVTISQATGPFSGKGGLLNLAGAAVTLTLENITLANSTVIGGNSLLGQGGAVYARSGITVQGSTASFLNNTALGGNGANLGQGGAIYISGNARMANNTLTFSNNTALAGSGSTAIGNNSGQGGAIYKTTGGAFTITSGTYTFSHNIARGGNQNTAPQTNAGQGGAIAHTAIMNLDNGLYVFNNNIAQGGDGNIASTTGNGRGGAISSSGQLNIKEGSYSFINNLAQGGSNNTGLSGRSGWGGAIMVFTQSFLTGGDFLFKGNTAAAGVNNANGDASGLGGAIFADATLRIETGAIFQNNSAIASANDPSSGRGGAIFAHARGSALFLSPNVGQDMIFKGNTQRNGAPNSIYFGRVDSGTANINVRMHPRDNARIIMYDPIESQPDNLIGAGGTAFGNMTMLITKQEAGIWSLGGTSTLPSQAELSLQQGTFHMMTADTRLHLTNPSQGLFSITTNNGSVLRPTVSRTDASLITAINTAISRNPTVEVSGLASLAPGVLYHKEIVQSKNALTGTGTFTPLNNSLVQAEINKTSNALVLSVVTQAMPSSVGLAPGYFDADGFFGSGAYSGVYQLAWDIDQIYNTGILPSAEKINEINLLGGYFAASMPLFGKSMYSLNSANLNVRRATWREYKQGETIEPEYSVANRMWASGTKGWASMDSQGSMRGMDSDMFGVNMGYDLIFTPRLLAGFTFGTSFATVESKVGDLAKMESTSYFGGVYSSLNLDPVVIDAAFFYGNSENTTINHYTSYGVTTTGRFHTRHIGADLSLGYVFEPIRSFRVTPMVGVEYYRGKHTAFAEKASDGNFTGMARSFDATSYESVQIPAGLRLSYALQGEYYTLEPYAAMTYARELADTTGEINTRLTEGKTQWTAKGIDPGRDIYRLNLGLNAKFNNTLTIGANYSLERRDRFTDNTLGLQLGISF